MDQKTKGFVGLNINLLWDTVIIYSWEHRDFHMALPIIYLIITHKPLMITSYWFCFWTPFQSYQKDLPSKPLVLEMSSLQIQMKGFPHLHHFVGLCYGSLGRWQTLFAVLLKDLVKDSPSQRGTVELQTTFPSCRIQVMDSEPWVFTKPSSQWKDTELPSRNLSPNRRPFTGMPGSWHSFWPNAEPWKRKVSNIKMLKTNYMSWQRRKHRIYKRMM